MPSPAGTRVSSSVLDLGNYSTMVIDLPSADSTVLLKVHKQGDINCLNNGRCQYVSLLFKDGAFC